MVTAESLLQSRFVIDMVSLDSISFTWLASEARMTLKIVAQTKLTARQWSREKCAILSLKPGSHVRVLTTPGKPY